MYQFLRPTLFSLPPEASHRAAVRALQMLGSLVPADPPRVQSVQLWGLDFPNPVGLAAGFDKDGECVRGLAVLGFGFLEVGAVTPRPQSGSERPRLFRLSEHAALINRMGFNNAGAAALASRLAGARPDVPVGVNIGCNSDTPPESVVEDYCQCLDALWQVADFITVNVSSPNTPGLRDWGSIEQLPELLEALYQRREKLLVGSGRSLPLLVKLSPDSSDEALATLAGRLRELGVEGVVATNTTLAREGVAAHWLAGESGGLSGAPLAARASACIRLLRAELGTDIPIIGVGGIDSPEAAREKLEAGAALVQVYTGLIYRGPGLVRQILCALRD